MKISVWPLRWNVQSRFYKPNELEYAFSQKELEEAALMPAIIHYSDREKPWQNSCRHLLKSYYDFYKSRLSNEWLEQYKINSIFDFISYDLRGDKAEIFFTLGNVKKSIIINREFGKKIYRAIKYNQETEAAKKMASKPEAIITCVYFTTRAAPY